MLFFNYTKLIAVKKGSNSVPDRQHMKNRKMIIGVMGAGEGAKPTDVDNAFELGKLIAAEGWILLSGGVDAGVMQAVNRGAQTNNGISVGILPRQDSPIADGVTIPIMTDMGSGRNNINSLTSDVVVACGMGPGVSSEISLALQKRANKPVVLLDPDETAEKFFKSLRPELVYAAKDAAEAIALIKKLI